MRPRPADAAALAELSVPPSSPQPGGAMVMDAPVDPAPYLPEQTVSVAPVLATPIGEGELLAAPGEELDPIQECNCGDLLCGKPMERCRGFWPAWLNNAGGGWPFEPLYAGPPSLLSASDVPFERSLDLVEIVLSRQADPWSELFEAPALEVLDAPDLVAAAEMRSMP